MAGAIGRETPAEPACRLALVSAGLASTWLALCVWPQVLLANAPAPAQPVLERLDPARRAKVLAAIAGLIILGFGLMVLAWLGAKATRRYMNREPVLSQKPPTGTPVREKDWAEKPMGSPFEE